MDPGRALMRELCQQSTAILRRVPICASLARDDMRIVHGVRLSLFAAALLVQAAPAPAQTPELTAAERDWLKRHGPIRVGAVESEGATLDMLGTSGEYLGITADYLKLIQDRLGLKIAIV